MPTLPTPSPPPPNGEQQQQRLHEHQGQRLASPRRGIQHHGQWPLPRGAESAGRERLSS